MKQHIVGHHFNDNGNPTGGVTRGTGISILWQSGPLGRGADRQEPNGAFVEGVIQAAIDRLEYFQSSKFVSAYNEKAIGHLQLALSALEARTLLIRLSPTDA